MMLNDPSVRNDQTNLYNCYFVIFPLFALFVIEKMVIWKPITLLVFSSDQKFKSIVTK